MRRTVCSLATIAFALSGGGVAAAQTSMSPLTIGAAVEAASRELPSAIEAVARAEALGATVREVSATNLPRLDGLWQLNRASRNNVFGLLLPQSIVPPISGPVLGTDDFESAWGSAAGLLFSMEVFDFGRRAAAVQAARADVAAGDAELALARLNAGLGAADAYLSVLGTQQSVVAARANVSRLEALRGAVKAQVDAELKPGADQSRLDAELASARNRLIATEQSLGLGLLRLAEAMGRPEIDPVLDAGPLLQNNPGLSVAPANQAAQHPSIRAATEYAKAAEARREMTERLFRPKIFFNGALAMRASAAQVDGTIDNGRGLWPDVPNWAAGLTVTFPFLDLTASRARASVEAAEVTARQARVISVVQRSRIESRAAQVMIEAATKMAANIPVQLAAARLADAQARARYDAGLTGITEVADAQRLLAQAETEDALASLALWRARLAQASAEGDLSGFLQEAARPTGPRVRP